MGYDHTMSVAAKIRNGVTVAEVQEAIGPIFEVFSYPADFLENQTKPKYEHTFDFDPLTQELYVYTNGTVFDSFISFVEQFGIQLSAIVAEPGVITLMDCETADPDNTTEVFFGPSESEIKSFKFNLRLTEAMSLLHEFIGDTGVETLKSAATALCNKPAPAVSAQNKNEVLISADGGQREYLVKWEIDVIADNAVQAAREAMAFMPHPASDSVATVFSVEDEMGVNHEIDLAGQHACVIETRPS